MTIVKQFCSESDCKQETAGRCGHCKRILCYMHVYTSRALDLFNQRIHEIERITTLYLRQPLELSDWRSRHTGEDDPRRGTTHKAFYTQIIPTVSNITIPEQSLCVLCFDTFVTKARNMLLTRFSPAVRTARRSGALCTNDANIICFRDAEILCSQCRQARCKEHASVCEQCSQVFCCDELHYHSTESVSFSTARGACAAGHKHSIWKTILSGQGNRTFHWKRP